MFTPPKNHYRSWNSFKRSDSYYSLVIWILPMYMHCNFAAYNFFVIMLKWFFMLHFVRCLSFDSIFRRNLFFFFLSKIHEKFSVHVGCKQVQRSEMWLYFYFCAQPNLMRLRWDCVVPDISIVFSLQKEGKELLPRSRLFYKIITARCLAGITPQQCKWRFFFCLQWSVSWRGAFLCMNVSFHFSYVQYSISKK